MPHTIHSIIEVHTEGCTMPHKKKTRPHDHHYKSEAKSDKNRFFHKEEVKQGGITQTTSVTVNVDQKDDCLTGCFAAITKCFKS